MRAQNSDSDPIFVNNLYMSFFSDPIFVNNFLHVLFYSTVGKTMHYAFTSIYLDACVQDQRRQFFPHGSNIYSSDIEFLVNGVSNLLSRDSAEQTNIYFCIDSHNASSLNSRGWERAAPCADGNYSIFWRRSLILWVSHVSLVLRASRMSLQFLHLWQNS